jgi:hypothetical protein
LSTVAVVVVVPVLILPTHLLNSTAAPAADTAPEPETKPAETSGPSSPTLFQKLKVKFLHSENKAKGKEAPVKEEPQSTNVDPVSVPEAKPEQKETKFSIFSKFRKAALKSHEPKSSAPAAAPVEEAPKAPESVETSAAPAEVCQN